MKLSRRPLRAALAFLGTALALQGCLGADESEEGTPEAVNPSHGEALTMSACGTVLGSFDGTNAYSNGNDTGTGYSCAGGGTYGLQYQCVELVMRHFKTHWGLRWYGNAKDLLANAPKADVEVRYNGDGAHPPVPGDMMIWTQGTYGHVALVTAVTANSVEILEQNVKGNGHASLAWDGATVGVRWGTWKVAGWAHAKANGSGGTGGTGGSGTGGSGTGGSTGGTGGSTGGTGGAATGGWDCAGSSYQGNQYWTCSGGALHKCVNGVAQEQACPEGCNVGPLGTDDTCKSSNPPPPPPPTWDCANSSYQGQQIWTCSGGDIYKCVNGVPQVQDCGTAGCNVNPLGTDDTCKGSTPPPVNWSCASSSYQGQQIWTCSGGDIYKCVNGVPQMVECGANGCQVNPLGTDDVCK